MAGVVIAGTATQRHGNPDPRAALAAVIDAGSDSYAALSRMLDRPPGYLRRFVVDGVPIALRPDEHRRLADYFGLSERALGIRDLWAHHADPVV
ncbi:hypothetical protein [Sphingomonas melonis]|uniref:hypothetical protein n=1 Tax=Sphingomonas melonis TaxID=152682 RepID=UPI00036ED13C|nr:hypothetical protein [Sphingomonas melonis]